ncbi:hypothetical protein CK203_114085 [Vitis vinifera]|uniref:Uncharacterized protein n=1 Tax=Vitis vinifera TaxID=29760 RepID=A0A438C8A5_VITVI|nr:hypothetical protein CK203_114085 [Vitis vinifera]
MEEISWRQKSRQIWLKEGDKNTGFFHKMANSNSRRNCLKKIKVRGIGFNDQDIQRGVVRAYQDLLSDPGGWHPSMSSLEFDRIGREEAARLEEMFSWKSPQERWAEDLRDYRPISLVGGLYKILAKVLANRLKKVVSKVVSSSQNAFVEGRQILDAALIANEAIDSMLKGDEAGVLCKLDLEKAYDHINWDFLMLRGRGGNGIQVSHLYSRMIRWSFARTQDQMAVLSWLLMWFEAISGLNITWKRAKFCRWEELRMLRCSSQIGGWWDGVEERMRKRLALWKRQFISKGGRITLIRSTLASMPIYLMSLMRIPRVVRLRLEKIQRDFLWGGHEVWGREGGWISCEVREGYGVGLWKEIRKEGVLLFKNASFTVGDDAWVEDCWDSMGDAGDGILVFLSFNDWELEAVASLLSVLQGKRLNVGMEDRVVWNASKNGIFSVKSLYNTLDSGGAVPFPWRIIWSPCVPTKVGFFAWEASWGKVLTQDHLKRRGWSLANRCFLCCDDEETINHILIHCPKARCCGILCLRCLGLIGSFSSRLKTLSLVGPLPL